VASSFKGKTFRPVTDAEVEEWRILHVEERWDLNEIAAEYRRGRSTVWRRLSRLGVLRTSRVPDLARYRRMVAAREGAPHGSGHELAARFGLTLGSWEVMLHRARAALSQ
jgi:hypothetical protein